MYSFTNSRGTIYYLHSKDVTLKNGSGVQTIFFFSKSQEDALDTLPEGKVVIENQRSGLPFLKSAE